MTLIRLDSLYRTKPFCVCEKILGERILGRLDFGEHFFRRWDFDNMGFWREHLQLHILPFHKMEKRNNYFLKIFSIIQFILNKEEVQAFFIKTFVFLIGKWKKMNYFLTSL